MVSVIIVVYNASEYIRFAIESVLGQTYKDIEIIAVDDGSSDSTVAILSEYAHFSNFTLVRKEHTKNLGGNRNEAIRISKGENIAFIDGDDIWEAEKLDEQLRYLNEYDMICSNAILIDENNRMISDRITYAFNCDVDLGLQDLLLNNWVTGSSVLMKKSAIENAGLFEDGPDTRAEDYILWLSYLKNGINKIRYINRPLLRYRIHDKNWSNSTTNDWIRLLRRTVEIRTSYILNEDVEVSKSAKRGCITMYLEMAKANLKRNHFSESRENVKKVLELYDSRVTFKYLKYLLVFIYVSFLSLFRKKQNDII